MTALARSRKVTALLLATPLLAGGLTVASATAANADPVGTRLLYTAANADNSALETKTSDGEGKFVTTFGLGPDDLVRAVSDDGQRVLFDRYDLDSCTTVPGDIDQPCNDFYIMDLSNSGVKTLVADDLRVLENDVALSSDGRTFYWLQPSADETTATLHTVPLTGSDTEQTVPAGAGFPVLANNAGVSVDDAGNLRLTPDVTNINSGRVLVPAPATGQFYVTSVSQTAGKAVYGLVENGNLSTLNVVDIATGTVSKWLDAKASKYDYSPYMSLAPDGSAIYTSVDVKDGQTGRCGTDDVLIRVTPNAETDLSLPCGISTVAAYSQPGGSTPTPGPSVDKQPADLTMTIPATTVEYGQSVTVRLSSDVPNSPIRLEARQYGQAGFTTIRNLTTDSNGSAVTTVKPSKRTELRWVFTGNDSKSANYTKALPVTIRPKISGTYGTRVRRGTVSTSSGTVGPGLAGKPVYFQKYVGGRWVNVASGRIASNSSYRLSYRVPNTVTSYQVRLYVPATPYTAVNYALGRTSTF